MPSKSVFVFVVVVLPACGSFHDGSSAAGSGGSAGAAGSAGGSTGGRPGADGSAPTGTGGSSSGTGGAVDAGSEVGQGRSGGGGSAGSIDSGSADAGGLADRFGPSVDAAIGGALPPEAVMRIQVNWSAELGYMLAPTVKEASGTTALAKYARREDPLGSFVGVVSDASSGTRIFQRTIGTGHRYREAVRALTFRYPELERPFVFTLYGENSTTGAREQILEQTLNPATFERLNAAPVELVPLRAAEVTPALLVNFYAEGYLASGRNKFLADARELMAAIDSADFPNRARLEFRAVWSPSAAILGPPRDLGMPVAERDSFLGLYYPYWLDYPRWDGIVYPTRERRFRDAVGQVPYDYPIAVMDTAERTNVGNYNELTAVAIEEAQAGQLFLHELGHYFGLNEEYSSGATELAFASGIPEPWSQNITFQTDRANLKWLGLVSASTPIPTPVSAFTGSNVGAYPGGYGGIDPRTRIPVPDRQCLMSSGSSYCPVCRAAIAAKISFDLGE